MSVKKNAITLVCLLITGGMWAAQAPDKEQKAKAAAMSVAFYAHAPIRRQRAINIATFLHQRLSPPGLVELVYAYAAPSLPLPKAIPVKRTLAAVKISLDLFSVPTLKELLSDREIIGISVHHRSQEEHTDTWVKPDVEIYVTLPFARKGHYAFMWPDTGLLDELPCVEPGSPIIIDEITCNKGYMRFKFILKSDRSLIVPTTFNQGFTDTLKYAQFNDVRLGTDEAGITLGNALVELDGNTLRISFYNPDSCEFLTTYSTTIKSHAQQAIQIAAQHTRQASAARASEDRVASSSSSSSSSSSVGSSRTAALPTPSRHEYAAVPSEPSAIDIVVDSGASTSAGDEEVQVLITETDGESEGEAPAKSSCPTCVIS